MVQREKLMLKAIWTVNGGGSQESNLPGRFLIPLTSFEDWAAHQRPKILHWSQLQITPILQLLIIHLYEIPITLFILIKALKAMFSASICVNICVKNSLHCHRLLPYSFNIIKHLCCMSQSITWFKLFINRRERRMDADKGKKFWGTHLTKWPAMIE